MDLAPGFISHTTGPANYDGGSIVNLAAALAGGFAIPATVPMLTGIDDRLASARTIVLVLLDGVGERQLRDHVPGGHLATHRQRTLTSVFPSSTAPAITSLLTARAPAAHGNPGWFMYEPLSREVIRTLPMDVRASPQRSVITDCWRWQPWTLHGPVDRLALQPADIVDSTYSRRAFARSERMGYESLDQIAPILQAYVRRPGRERGYVYVYVSDFDSIAHAYGCRSEQAHDCLHALDDWFACWADAVVGSNTLLLTTADHGFVDIGPAGQHHLDDWPALAECLARPLTGEPRVVYCQVRQDSLGRFDALAQDALGSICDSHASADLLRAGWFGPAAGDDFLERIGNRTLVMQEGHSLVDHVPGERSHRQIGMHGGVTDDEMLVPLIVVA